MQLTKDASIAYRLTSVQLPALGAILAGLSYYMPQLQAYLPAPVYGALFVASIVARVIHQPGAKAALEAKGE